MRIDTHIHLFLSMRVRLLAQEEFLNYAQRTGVCVWYIV
jgi:hypothetical protein